MIKSAAFWASFIPSLAAKLSSDLINAVLGELRGSIRRAIETGPEQAALQQAYESAFQACLPYMSPPREDLKDHYAELLYSFVKRQKVSEIFAELVDVRPGVNLDIPALEAAFKADYDTETLPEFNFSLVMQVFAKEYVSAVEHSKVLHHIVEVKHLKAIVANLEQLAEPVKDIADNTTVLPAIEKKLVELTDAVLSGKEDLNKLVQAIAAWLTHRDQVTLKNLFLVGQKLDLFLSTPGRHDTAEVTAIKDEVQQLREEVSRRAEQGLSTSELEQLEEIYRSEISACHSLLTFQGMLQNNQPVALPITDIFVSLSVAAAKPRINTPEEEKIRRQLEAADKFPQHSSLSAEQRETLLRRLEEINQEPSHQSEEKSDITQALLKSKSQALVVLGDPGAGKTTLLRYLALAFAENHAAQRLDLAEQRLPIFVPLAAYNATLDNNHDFPLSEFLAHYYKTNRELPGLTPLFKKYLEQGQAIALFDGLDEVLDVSTRQLIAQRVQAFINRYLPLGNRIIMTSRVVGYQEVRLSRENIAHFRVLSLDETGIAKFIRAWSLAFEASSRRETNPSNETVREAKTKEQGLAQAIEAPSVKKLAGNPLLLTILAVVYCQQGLRLPRRRVELYDRYSRVLLETWNRVRSQSGRSVGKPLDFLRTAKVLSRLALWLQQNRPSGMARGREVQQQLCNYYLSRKGLSSPSLEERDAVEQEAQQFLQDVREHSGLLIERGKDTYGFMHLTFQEYFTAWALAKMPLEEKWQIISPHLHDSRWREVILLTAGQIGVVDANEWEATAFLRKILEAGSRFNDLLQRDEILAAACLADEIEIRPDLSQIIVERIGKALRSPYPQVAKAAGEAMGNLQQTILTNLATAETIKGLAQPQAWKRRIAVKTLAKLDSSTQRTQALLSTLADSDYSIRTSTVQALSQLQSISEEVLSAIATRIKQEPGARLRFQLDLLLWQQKPREPNACSQLEESFLEAYLETVQPYFLTYRNFDLFKSLLEQPLTKYDTPTVQSEFLRLLFKSRQAYVRQLGLNFLEYLDLDLSIAQPFWIQALNDSDWRVRRRALQRLFDLKEVSDELAAKIVDASQREQYLELKQLALGLSLKWQQLTANESDLHKLLSSSWWQVRQVAAQAFGKLEQLSEVTLTTLVQGLSDSNYNVLRAIRDTLTILAEGNETVVTKLRQALPQATGNSQTQIFLTLVAALKQLDSNNENYLRELLGDSDWQVRQVAAQTLGKLEQLSEAVLTTLIQGLNDSNFNVRQAIQYTLTTLAQRDEAVVTKLRQALPQATMQSQTHIFLTLAALEQLDSNDENYLCELLRDSDLQLRQVAAQTLGKLEQLSEAVLIALIQGLNDSNFNVRQAIQYTLTTLAQRDEAVVTKLRQVLPQATGQSQTQIFLILATLEQLDSNDENYLRELLGDSDWQVRQVAAQTLGKLEQLSEAVLTTLIQGLNDSNFNVRQAIQYTLTTLAQRDEAVVTKLRQALPQATMQSQTHIFLILAALEQLDSNDENYLCELLESSNWQVRQAAVRALSQLKPMGEEVLSVITKRMEQEPKAILHFELGLAVWKQKSRYLTVCRQLEESFIEAYLETWPSDSKRYKTWLRFELLLNKLITKDDTQTIQAEFIGLLFKSKQTYVRKLSLNFMTFLDLDNSIAQTLWFQALNDSDRRVQKTALQSLFNQKEVPEELVVEVVSFSLKEQHPEIKQLALGLSLKLGGLRPILEQMDSNDEKLLCELLKSSDWQVQQAAAKALGKLVQLSEAMLIDLVQGLSYSNFNVREAIQNTLTTLAKRDEAVVTKLCQALPQATGKTRINILKALVALEQLDSTDESLLCELLESSDWQVQQAAAKALGKLEQLSEATLIVLVQGLSYSNFNVREAIQDTLTTLAQRDETVVTKLCQALPQATGQTRINILKALVALEQLDSTDESLLCELLESSDWRVQQAAAKALGKLEQLSEATLIVLVQGLSYSYYDVIRAIRDTLTNLTQRDVTVVTKLRQALPQANGQTRVNTFLALEALEQLNTTDEKHLCELLESSDLQVWYTAVRLLGKLKQLNETTLTALIQCLNNSNSEARYGVQQVLSQHKECLDPVIFAILSTAFPTVLIRVVELISNLGIPCSDRIQASLQNMLNAQSSNLRRAAANALLSCEIVNDEIINVFKTDLSHESDYINEQAYQNLIKISGITAVG